MTLLKSPGETVEKSWYSEGSDIENLPVFYTHHHASQDRPKRRDSIRISPKTPIPVENYNSPNINGAGVIPTTLPTYTSPDFISSSNGYGGISTQESVHTGYDAKPNDSRRLTGVSAAGYHGSMSEKKPHRGMSRGKNMPQVGSTGRIAELQEKKLLGGYRGRSFSSKDEFEKTTDSGCSVNSGFSGHGGGFSGRGGLSQVSSNQSLFSMRKASTMVPDDESLSHSKGNESSFVYRENSSNNLSSKGSKNVSRQGSKNVSRQGSKILSRQNSQSILSDGESSVSRQRSSSGSKRGGDSARIGAISTKKQPPASKNEHPTRTNHISNQPLCALSMSRGLSSSPDGKRYTSRGNTSGRRKKVFLEDISSSPHSDYSIISVDRSTDSRLSPEIIDTGFSKTRYHTVGCATWRKYKYDGNTENRDTCKNLEGYSNLDNYNHHDTSYRSDRSKGSSARVYSSLASSRRPSSSRNLSSNSRKRYGQPVSADRNLSRERRDCYLSTDDATIASGATSLRARECGTLIIDPSYMSASVQFDRKVSELAKRGFIRERKRYLWENFWFQFIIAMAVTLLTSGFIGFAFSEFMYPSQVLGRKLGKDIISRMFNDAEFSKNIMTMRNQLEKAEKNYQNVILKEWEDLKKRKQAEKDTSESGGWGAWHYAMAPVRGIRHLFKGGSNPSPSSEEVMDPKLRADPKLIKARPRFIPRKYVDMISLKADGLKGIPTVKAEGLGLKWLESDGLPTVTDKGGFPTAKTVANGIPVPAGNSTPPHGGYVSMPTGGAHRPVGIGNAEIIDGFEDRRGRPSAHSERTLSYAKGAAPNERHRKPIATRSPTSSAGSDDFFDVIEFDVGDRGITFVKNDRGDMDVVQTPKRSKASTKGLMHRDPSPRAV